MSETRVTNCSGDIRVVCFKTPEKRKGLSCTSPGEVSKTPVAETRHIKME
ncbi:MAG: hypothetical protein ABI217_10170 [Chthoniobacterales bacterium]